MNNPRDEFIQKTFDLLPKDILNMILMKLDIDSALFLCKEYYDDFCRTNKILEKIIKRDFDLEDRDLADDVYEQYKQLESLYKIFDNAYNVNFVYDYTRGISDFRHLKGKYPNLDVAYHMVRYLIMKRKNKNVENDHLLSIDIDHLLALNEDKSAKLALRFIKNPEDFVIINIIVNVKSDVLEEMIERDLMLDFMII